jgi:hypothetical protein
MRRPSCIGRQGLWIVTLLCVLSLTAFPAKASQDVWKGIGRIVAIGDLEGDYDQFRELLRAAGLIDKKGNWIGEKAHLVQLGDVVDRGDDSRKLMDYLMKLEDQARKDGGRVHVLIGNHEAMNLYGDLRYTTAGEFEAFRDRNSEELRDAYFEQHKSQLLENPPPEGIPTFDKAYREEWNAKIPLGWVEHRIAFGPNGKYGKWIREHNTIIKINDTIFLHAGISPSYATHSIRQINEQVRSELNDFSKLEGGMVLDQEGPLWHRGLARESENGMEEHVDTVLQTHGANRIVIGHTTTGGTVVPRFGGKVMQIDVGLSEFRGRRGACLIIADDNAYTVYRERN